MNNPEAILVIGHRNPDTDAIASAVGYAWVLNQNGVELRYIAGRAGKVNAQTTFALERFGIEAPPLVTDIWARVGDLAESLPSLRKGQTLLDACKTIAHTRRPAPLLGDNQKPIGLLTGSGLFANLAEALSSASVLALAREFDRPAETAIDPGSTVLNADDHVQDIIGQLLRTEQDDFVVVDEAGRYTGLCRKSALLAPPRRKVVMVDHNEPAQSVPGLEEAEIVEVLDHHRLGNMPTVMPIAFRVDPVGSCSTLVAERGIDAGEHFPMPVAGLLLCGILSDTLVFRSPTTTERDRNAALQLAGMAGLAGTTDNEKMASIQELGQSLLASGTGLGSRPAEEVISSDLKFYEAGGLSVGIAQVEVAHFRELVPRLDDLRKALADLAESRRLALALLMVTDVVLGNSRLVAVGQARVIAALPYARLDDGVLDAPGVVSRKKQLLPAVLAVLSQFA
jgi:manganese-dependent inorganic pyrophosphatase